MYAIIRVAKIKSMKELRESGKHNNREHDQTKNADPKLKHLNTVEFGVKDTKEIVEFVKGKIKAVEESTGRKIRSDAVIAQEYLLNASPEFFKTLSPAMEKKWIEKNIEFLKDKYGEENIVQVVAHRDEDHLHLQALVMPITEDENGIRLSAKSITGGSSSVIRKLQTEYAKQMEGFGLKRGREHANIDYDELKAYKQEMKEKLQEAEKEAENVKYGFNPFATIKKITEEKALLQMELKETNKEKTAIEEALGDYIKLSELVGEGKIGQKEVREILGKNNYIKKNGFRKAIEDARNKPKHNIQPEKRFHTFTDIQETKIERDMRRFEQETIEKIKGIPITEYMARVRHTEGKAQGNEIYYTSPFKKEEKTPSFCVDPALNVWYDYSQGFGGDLIELDMKLRGKTFVQSVKELSEAFMDETLSPTPPKAEHTNFQYQDTTQKNIEITSVKEIQNTALLSLLEQRSLSIEVSRKVLKEVSYKRGSNHYYGIGMECDNGTWATFNRYGKTKIGQMDTTTIMAKEKTNNYVVFEGMTDYVARLTEISPKEITANVIVLHGANNTQKALAKLKEAQIGKIYIYAHNDDSGIGRKVVQEFKEAFGEKVEDFSYKYAQYNDYNEKLINEMKPKGKNKGMDFGM